MNRILHIFKKEVRDMLRDKRVLNGVLIMPVFMVFLFTMLLGSITEKLEKDPDLKIAIVKNEASEKAKELVKDRPQETKGAKQQVTFREVNSLDEGLKLLNSGDIHAVVQIPDLDSIGEGKQAEVTAHFTQESPLSMMALRVISSLVEKQNKEHVEQLLVESNHKKEEATLVKFTQVDHTKKEGLGGSGMLTMLPYLIVLWAFYGGMSIVSDLVAGEKERGTMETLLISPITRTQIAIGKLSSLTAICFASSMTTMIGILVIGMINLPQTKNLFPTGVHISAFSMIATVLIVLPLAAMFSGAMVAISALAKNIRESQTYLTALSFIVLMPSIASQFVGLAGVEKASWVQWTPILNTAISLKGILAANPNWSLIGISVLTSVALGVLTCGLSIAAFQREAIVNRS